jgi:hypothetical protein
MTPDAFMGLLLPQATWPLIGCVLSLVVAAVCAVALAQGKRIPPVLAGGAVALPWLVVAGVTALAMSTAPTEPDGLAGRLAAAVGLRLAAFLLVLPPAGVLALGCAAAGARRAPRRAAPALATLVAVLAISAIPIAIGASEDDLWFAVLRSVAYLAVGALTAAAMLSADPEGVWPEACAASAAGYAVVVAAGESAARALPELLLAFALPARRVDVRGAFVDEGFATVVGPWVTPGWITAMLAAGVAIGVMGFAARRRGSAVIAVAALWPLLAVAALALGTPDADDFHALAAGLPAPEATDAP